MNEKFTDVDFQELDDGVYYTAVQVAEILGETDSTIRSWCKESSLGDVLNIKKVNGRNKFTKNDIEKLKFVKELRDRNYSISQTREYISKQGFQFGEFDSGLINPKDPLGFEALSIMLAKKQDEKLELFKKDIYQMLSLFIDNINQKNQEEIVNFTEDALSLINDKMNSISNIKDEVATTVDTIVSDKINTLSGLDNKIASEVKHVVDTKLDIAIESQYRQNKTMFDSVEENVIRATKNEIEGQISGIKNDVNEISKISNEKLDKTLNEISKSVEGIDKQVREVKKEVGIAYVSMEEIRGKKSLFERLFKK